MVNAPATCSGSPRRDVRRDLVVGDVREVHGGRGGGRGDVPGRGVAQAVPGQQHAGATAHRLPALGGLVGACPACRAPRRRARAPSRSRARARRRAGRRGRRRRRTSARRAGAPARPAAADRAGPRRRRRRSRPARRRRRAASPAGRGTGRRGRGRAPSRGDEGQGVAERAGGQRGQRRGSRRGARARASTSITLSSIPCAMNSWARSSVQPVEQDGGEDPRPCRRGCAPRSRSSSPAAKPCIITISRSRSREQLGVGEPQPGPVVLVVGVERRRRRAPPRTPSRIRSQARSKTSRNSSSLVPKIRTTYGWETPASLATASVLVPAYPPRAKARVAASSTSSRRSSALIRVRSGAVVGGSRLTCYQSIT